MRSTENLNRKKKLTNNTYKEKKKKKRRIHGGVNEGVNTTSSDVKPMKKQKNFIEKFHTVFRENFLNNKNKNNNDNHDDPGEYPEEPLQIIPLKPPFGKSNEVLILDYDKIIDKLNRTEDELAIQTSHIYSRQKILNSKRDEYEDMKERDKENIPQAVNYGITLAFITIKDFFNKIVKFIGGILELQILNNFLHTTYKFAIPLVLFFVVLICIILAFKQSTNGGSEKSDQRKSLPLRTDISFSSSALACGDKIKIDTWDFLNPSKVFSGTTESFLMKNKKLVRLYKNFTSTTLGALDEALSVVNLKGLNDIYIYKLSKYTPKSIKNDIKDTKKYARYDNIKKIELKYFLTGHYWKRILIDAPSPDFSLFDIENITNTDTDTYTETEKSDLKKKITDNLGNENFVLDNNEIRILKNKIQQYHPEKFPYIYIKYNDNLGFIIFNEILEKITDKVNMDSLFMKYISIIKPKQVYINIDEQYIDDDTNEKENYDIFKKDLPEILNLKNDEGYSISDTKIITIPYMIELDTSNDIYLYKPDIKKSYYKESANKNKVNLNN